MSYKFFERCRRARVRCTRCDGKGERHKSKAPPRLDQPSFSRKSFHFSSQDCKEDTRPTRPQLPPNVPTVSSLRRTRVVSVGPRRFERPPGVDGASAAVVIVVPGDHLGMKPRDELMEAVNDSVSDWMFDGFEAVDVFWINEGLLELGSSWACWGPLRRRGLRRSDRVPHMMRLSGIQPSLRTWERHPAKRPWDSSEIHRGPFLVVKSPLRPEK